MDNLVSSLGKFTVLLDPANAKAAVEFGNSEKARMACDAAFQLANRCAAAHGFPSLCNTLTACLLSTARPDSAASHGLRLCVRSTWKVLQFADLLTPF